MLNRILTFLIVMSSFTTMAQNGKASTEKKTFSRTTSVETTINADASIIWKLLTDAPNFPKWNSTVVSIEGDIKEGEKIKLKSTLDTSRTFKLKVKEMVPNQMMVWGDALGKRSYTLESLSNGGVKFSMSEKIGGFMFPLFASKIPPFDDAFTQFAADLKKEAERIAGQ